MKRIIFFMVFLVLFSHLVFTLSCSDTEPGSTKEFSTEKSVEYKLACIDCGYYIDDSDTRIVQYKNLLDKLETKTVNSRISISDITVTTQRLLKEEAGIDRSLVEVLNDFNKIIPEGSKGIIKLEEIAAAYVVLMTP